MEAGDRVFTLPDLVEPVMTRARITVIDPKAAPEKLAPGRVSLYCVTRALRDLNVLPLDALEAAAGTGSAHSDENLSTIRLAVK
jgi:hypothetical protein